MDSSSQTHRREKTESFTGSQMDFEFPNSSHSDFNDLRSAAATFSEVSSNGAANSNTFKQLTRVSISSTESNTMSTAELFQQLENAGYQDEKKSTMHRSQYSVSAISVRIKDEATTNDNNTIALSSRYTASSNSLALTPRRFISRSASIQQFRTSPSIRIRANATSPVGTLSKQSTLKRSNAIRQKEGWLTRLMKRLLQFRVKFQNWRRIVTKKALVRKSNNKKKKKQKTTKSMISSPVMNRAITLTRNPAPVIHDHTDVVAQTTAEDTNGKQDNMDSYLRKEQQLVDLENLSAELLHTEETADEAPERLVVPASATAKQYPSSYPTPNVDMHYLDQEDLTLIYKMWSHYLKRTVMNRIQLKLDISEYKSSGENKRESVLDSIISDYASDEADDDDEEDSDGFESDTNNGHYSSATSISSYDQDPESIETESILESDLVSDYQSSYYPTRQNTVITRDRSIKRANSARLNRALSKKSATSNITYIEDLVNVKYSSNARSTAAEKEYFDKYYSYSNPYIGGQRSGLTRSPSFVIPKKQSLAGVREE